MNIKPVIAVTLVAVGVVVLASLGLGLLTPGKPVEFLGMNIAKGNGQFIPPVAGGLAFAGGIILLLIKSKRA
jgi:nitrate reductase gamma subunit